MQKMQQHIDIDEEQARLWRSVYSDLREILISNYGIEIAFASKDLPLNITSVYVDTEKNIIVKTTDDKEKLIEEYDDDVLFEIYQSVVARIELNRNRKLV